MPSPSPTRICRGWARRLAIPDFKLPESGSNLKLQYHRCVLQRGAGVAWFSLRPSHKQLTSLCDTFDPPGPGLGTLRLPARQRAAAATVPVPRARALPDARPLIRRVSVILPQFCSTVRREYRTKVRCGGPEGPAGSSPLPQWHWQASSSNLLKARIATPNRPRPASR